MSASDDKESVKGIMTKVVFTLSPRRRTIDALEMMIRKDVGSVVIVNKGKLVGIITERDIVRKITKSFDYLNRPLDETATKQLVTIKPETLVWEAFTLMLRKKIRRLPVMRGSKLVGIVTERDLFKWAVKVAYEPNIPLDIKKMIQQSP